MEVLVANTAFCWGIELAYQRIDQAAQENENLFVTHRCGPNPKSRTWDPLARITDANDAELHRRYPNLRRVFPVDSPADVGEGARIAIGHHGSNKAHLAAAKSRGAEVLDFKCPFISKFDHQVDQLAAEGYDIVAFGKSGNHHCEYARETAQRAGRTGLVSESVEAIREALFVPGRNWACVAQVTANVPSWERFRADLLATGTPVRIVDTVCSDSHDRQSEAVALAQRADCVLVINDCGGSTTSVFERCCAINPNVYLVDPDGPFPEAIHASGKTAIVGGIHVPPWIMRDYASRLRRDLDL